MNFSDPLSNHLRIPKKQFAALKRLKLETVKDLLYYAPIRHTHVSNTTTINNAIVGGEVTLSGRLSNLKIGKTFKRKIPEAKAVLTDISGETVFVRWLHQPYLGKMLRDGMNVQLIGILNKKNGKRMMINPRVAPLNDLPVDGSDSLFGDTETKELLGYPIYKETRGLSSQWIFHAVSKLIKNGALENAADIIPEYILNTLKLPPLATAIVWLHMPKSKEHAEAAKKRFSFEEMLCIQLVKQQRRAQFLKQKGSIISPTQQVVSDFTGRFGFTLTNAQQRVISEVLNDMQSGHPMQRLLQGDVGSGKTAVAATITHAVTSTFPKSQHYGALQVAYMAPTEVLATQLFEGFTTYFAHTPHRIALITGSGCRVFPSKVNAETWTNISKSQLLKWIANGEIAIVVGTHAVIGKKVAFKHLALAIVDEQHRFGVNQRFNLSKKQDPPPHYLSMSATPIPRTLSLTLYGDLDLSVLDELPAGRKKVITQLHGTGERNDMYTHIAKELEAGRQAYVICPRIAHDVKKSEVTEEQWNELSPAKKNALSMKAAEDEARMLQNDIFQNYRIGVMHSKLNKTDKAAVMERFSNHEIDILVSTSVVEVGVNVPNATCMIIEGAERYGLAQLHQLRGRVVRSSKQAYCWLCTTKEPSAKSKERLEAFIAAEDGFAIAEYDLALRGPGALIGTQQSGLSDIGMSALQNAKLVSLAQQYAKQLIEEDAVLENFPVLAQVVKGLTKRLSEE